MKKPTSSNFFLSTIIFFVLTLTVNAQLQNTNWFFGKGAGLNFNDGTQALTAFSNGQMGTTGGCATVSDSSGDLLFYTDSKNLWTKTHEPMKGTGMLFGSPNVSQNVIIVPNPAMPSQYYLFTNEGFEINSHGLSYTVIDMDEAGGLGMVLETSINTPLLPYSSEKLTAIFNPNDKTYWIISFGPGKDPKHSDTFSTFKLDENGISLHCQSTHEFLPENFEQSGGQMKISPDGTTLAMVHNTVDEKGPSYGLENVFSFDFKLDTGEIHTKKTYTINDALYCYGLEFSPDCDKFLVSSTHRLSDGAPECFIHQICYRNTGSLYIPEQIVGFSEETIYSLQMAIDGNIYGASMESSGLHCFANSNGLSQEVCFDANAIDLNGRYSTKGLPQLVPYNPVINKPEDTKIYTILENPFEEELEIKFHLPGQFEMRLMNSAGNKVMNKEFNISRFNQIITIDAEHLADGIYVLTIIDQDHNNEEYSETVLKIDD